MKPEHALHVVLRVVPEVGSLRRRDLYRAIRAASVVAAVRARIRIVHVSIQRTHVHLLVEAENKIALGRGMQGLQISAARNINTALARDGERRVGAVFVDRYYLVVIRSPTQARHALSYILNNWRKHVEDRSGVLSAWLVDPFSSGCLFADWQEFSDNDVLWELPSTYEPLIVVPPQSWLLREGWKLAGTISAREVPSKRR